MELISARYFPRLCLVSSLTSMALMNKCNGLNSLLSFRSYTSLQDVYSRKGKTNKEEKKMEYATQKYYDSTRSDTRMHLALDEESGIRPTKWQKRFLVLTRMYPNKQQIPEFILKTTILRMNGRLRLIYIFVAVVILFIIQFGSERFVHSSILEDRLKVSRKYD